MLAKRSTKLQEINEEQKRLITARGLPRHAVRLWLVLLYSLATIFTSGTNRYLVRQKVKGHKKTVRRQRLVETSSPNSSFRARLYHFYITSAVCARAAAVNCQKHSDQGNPTLSMRQMLVLADNGWSDLQILRISFDIVQAAE